MAEQLQSPVGIKELARILGLSTGTISRSLNNREGVNRETRSKVLEAARLRGYVRNGSARSLKEQSVSTAALFFAPFVSANQKLNPAALHMLKALHNEAAAAAIGLHVVFYKDDANLSAEVATHHFDAAIFYGHFESSSYALINELGVPSVILNAHTQFQDQRSITVDTQNAGFRAAQYLAALGHSKVALVTGLWSDLHGGGFLEGYRQAVTEFGLSPRPEWCVELPTHETNKDGSYRAVLRMLQGKERPTGILFASDWLALGGRRAAKEAGLQVPKDVSLIGFDNLPIANEIEPALTTFDIGIAKAAKLVIQITKQTIQRRSHADNAGAKEISLTPDLIKRGSCACIRHS